MVLLLMAFLSIMGGCGQNMSGTEPATEVDDAFDISVYSQYSPVEIEIMPLTELVDSGNSDNRLNIDIYVGLLDSFGSEIKSPGIFRFELYEHLQRSSEQKGRRIVIWSDIDLSEPAENNKYWQDFLRAYKFNLDFESQNVQAYVLQVTLLCPGGRRLSQDCALKLGN